MYMGVLLACTSVHQCIWYPQRLEDGTGSPGTGVADGCEPICGCCESNPGSLEDQSVFLTAKPSFQLPPGFFFMDGQSMKPKMFIMKSEFY